MTIGEALKQSKFQDIYQQAHLNILYTAAFFNQQAGQVLKPYGISLQQFNVLRILRGMKGQPATIKTLTERMIDKTSNASRLVDKLLAKKLVERQESAVDRRRVDVYITQAGLDLLVDASREMDELITSYWDDISQNEASQVSQLLDRLRPEIQED